MMMTRHWLIGVSLVAHVGVAVGLFVTGIWRLERLDHEHRAAIGLAVLAPPPPPPPEGGPAAAAPPQVTPKAKRRIVRDTQPVRPQPDATPELALASTATGSGQGAGSGQGTGFEGGDPDGIEGGVTCDLVAGPCAGQRTTCGDGVREWDEACDDGNRRAGDGCSASCAVEAAKPAVVAPVVLQGLRVHGDTQIHPPDVVKTTMLRDGRTRSVGVLKVCIQANGQISSVAIASSTKYPAFDARLVEATRAWRYRPYTVDGTPMPVCGMVTFVYSIR